MKILQLGKFYPPVLGGVETVTFDLAEGLAACGEAVDVLCANKTLISEIDYFSSGYRVFRSASFGMAFSTSLAPKLAWDLIKLQSHYDIIHVHLPNPLANLALWISRPKAKIVLHWHSDIVKQKHLLKLYEPIQQWLLRRADAIVATSPPYVDASPWLSQYKDKVVVIPIGINAQEMKIDVGHLAELRTRHFGKKVVFSLGRLTYYKGFDYLIEAARLLPDDVVVLIGGNGELKKSLETKIANMGLTRKVELIGKIPTNELPSYYALADIFCLPSIARSEAFGVVLLEAMAMGKPIVTTNIEGSGVPWVNKDGITGVNVAPKNAADLANALNKILLSHETLVQLSNASHQRFEANFTSSKMVERIQDLYHKVNGKFDYKITY